MKRFSEKEMVAAYRDRKAYQVNPDDEEQGFEYKGTHFKQEFSAESYYDVVYWVDDSGEKYRVWEFYVGD